MLGLLTLRPWSGYELAQQARRSLRFVWPKSERHLYAEPKKLVELFEAQVRSVYEEGLAQMQAVQDGQVLYPERLHLVALSATGRSALHTPD